MSACVKEYYLLTAVNSPVLGKSPFDNSQGQVIRSKNFLDYSQTVMFLEKLENNLYFKIKNFPHVLKEPFERKIYRSCKFTSSALEEY